MSWLHTGYTLPRSLLHIIIQFYFVFFLFFVIHYSAAIAASFEHLLNLQFRPEGLGVVCAERSDSTNHDNRNCQVEAVVRRYLSLYSIIIYFSNNSKYSLIASLSSLAIRNISAYLSLSNTITLSLLIEYS